MPKIKTRKGMADRVRLTRKGKLIRSHAWKSHLLTKKSPKRKRRFRQPEQISPSNARTVRRSLGT